ncbi:MAG: dephospho-CoA kinase [Candidatus Acetothermia bacterium]|nr:dephospho-CoA kinase [Candidatus Acetothermia bacterium]MDH7505059.1 dephospho-CoA kinase [Candidatus Acetothermia bacterium]
MIVIGLTGGIASGKSLVARELAKRPGFAAIEIDRLAWEVYRPGSPVYNRLVEHFGPGILRSGGEIDRKKLGEIVFKDRTELQFLSETVHPAITARLRELVERERRRGTKVLILEAAVLLESRHVERALFDYIIALKVGQEEQLRRLRERDGLSQEEAELRIKAQEPESLQGADYIIEASGRPEETVAKVGELIASLLGKGIE